jgi:hypothetical protein
VRLIGGLCDQSDQAAAGLRADGSVRFQQLSQA